MAVWTTGDRCGQLEAGPKLSTTRLHYPPITPSVSPHGSTPCDLELRRLSPQLTGVTTTTVLSSLERKKKIKEGAVDKWTTRARRAVPVTVTSPDPDARHFGHALRWNSPEVDDSMSVDLVAFSVVVPDRRCSTHEAPGTRKQSDVPAGTTDMRHHRPVDRPRRYLCQVRPRALRLDHRSPAAVRRLKPKGHP